jgi:hypothetical protein
MRIARSVLVIAAPSQLMFAQGKPAIAGVWRGQSPCEQKQSACRDETVVYRFWPLLDKPGSFSVSADSKLWSASMRRASGGSQFTGRRSRERLPGVMEASEAGELNWMYPS